MAEFDREVIIKSSEGASIIELNANTGRINDGGSSTHPESGAPIPIYGSLVLEDPHHNPIIELDASGQQIDGPPRHISVRNAVGNDWARISAGEQIPASIWLGGNGVSSAFYLFDREGDNLTPEQATVKLSSEGGEGSCWIGGHGSAGSLNLLNSVTDTTIQLDASRPRITVGGTGFRGGEFQINSGDNRPRICMDGLGAIEAGGNDIHGTLRLLKPTGTWGTILSAAGMLWMVSDDGSHVAQLGAETGLGLSDRSDLAEEFDLSEDSEPGTVLVIDQGEKLCPCRVAYDKRVAGVISGAGDYRPGIVLNERVTDMISSVVGNQPNVFEELQSNIVINQTDSKLPRAPVSLSGKVYCRVDAQYGPIEEGDLLTTSPTPGHAMKATDPARAFGSILGKALRAWKDGKGMIPILVSLQ